MAINTINSINNFSNNIPLNSIKKIVETEEKTPSFVDFFKKAIYDVNDAKIYEQKLTEKLMTGELENMHDLSIAKGIANVKMNALTEVISKVSEAYKEITRIQI